MPKITAFWRDFVDLLFPVCCEACQRSLHGSEYLLCTSCLLSLPKIPRDGPVAAAIEHRFAGYEAVGSVQAYLEYTRRGRVQSLLRALKYKGRPELGLLLGQLFARELVDAEIFPHADLLVPVPLHPRKQRERGFNQSEALAEGITRVTGLPLVPSLLRRTVYTETQTGKTKPERIANVKNIFRVASDSALSGSAVLLVDDVLTTGATLESCVEALLAANCTRIHIMTIAAARD